MKQQGYSVSLDISRTKLYRSRVHLSLPFIHYTILSGKWGKEVIGYRLWTFQNNDVTMLNESDLVVAYFLDKKKKILTLNNKKKMESSQYF